MPIYTVKTEEKPVSITQERPIKKPLRIVKKAEDKREKDIWSRVHPNAVYVAMDADEHWYGFENKPVWIESEEMWDDPKSTTYYPIPDWKENALPEKSLKRRPNK